MSELPSPSLTEATEPPIEPPSKPLKVLHIYRTYFPDTQGGGEEVIRQISMNTPSYGIESRIFSLSPKASPQPLQRPEATVYQVPQHFEIASCGMSFSAVKPFRAQARWADVLHYHVPWPFGDALHLFNPAVTGNKVSVITYHSDVVRQKLLYGLYKPMMEQFLKKIDRIVATSPNYAATSTVLRQQQHKVSVIPIGINEDNYPKAEATKVAEFKRLYGDRFMCFIGVLRYYKGLEFLINAAAQVNCPLVIAGKGPEEQALKKLAQQLQVNNVHFIGAISDADKMAMLTASCGLVFPSHLPAESFGISLLEAAMLSKPMISCEIGTGTSWVNLHQHTGLVVEPANPSALATAINQLVANPALGITYGNNARQRYEHLFTGKAMGEQYAQLYHHLYQQALASA